jgi:hypothetical protein
MRLAKSPPAEAVATRAFVTDFFNLVRRGEWSMAEARVSREAFPDGPGGLPSPRAEIYIATGEWDDDRSPVPLRLVGLNVCGCRIGTTDPPKVCIVDQQLCSVLKHKKPILQGRGWMIGAGAKVGDGVFVSLIIPTFKRGGPIDQETANQLSNPLKPFTMRIGLWKFVFQAVSEDLLGLMDSPKKSVAGSETLEWEAVDGLPVGATRLVSDGGLPVLGGNGWIGSGDRMFGADLGTDNPPLDLLRQPIEETVPRFVHYVDTEMADDDYFSADLDLDDRRTGGGDRKPVDAKVKRKENSPGSICAS